MIIINLNNKNEKIDSCFICKYDQRIEDAKGEVNARSFKNWGIDSGEGLAVPAPHLTHVVLLLNDKNIIRYDVEHQ